MHPERIVAAENITYQQCQQRQQQGLGRHHPGRSLVCTSSPSGELLNSAAMPMRRAESGVAVGVVA
jgi:hypothetical protein